MSAPYRVATSDDGAHVEVVCVNNLTPAEAQGLAQRLLKEAAEVEFASALNTAADGGES